MLHAPIVCCECLTLIVWRFRFGDANGLRESTAGGGAGAQPSVAPKPPQLPPEIVSRLIVTFFVPVCFTIVMKDVAVWRAGDRSFFRALQTAAEMTF